MIRYKVILTQTSIVDAKDEQEAKDKIVDTFDFGNLDVYAEELHPDDVNPDDAEHMKPMTKEEEYRNADVPDEVLSKNFDNDFIKHLKKFFKGEK